MKLKAERDAFTEAVSWTTKSLATHPTVPVLAGIRLSLTQGRLTVCSFDYEVSSQAQIDVVAGESGDALVSGRLLAEILKALPNKPINFAMQGSLAELTCGSARFTLPTMPVEDYPELPELPEIVGTIDGAEFAEAVVQVVVAVSRDETLPVLTGVQLELRGDRARLLATDRYRMAIRELSWRPTDPDIAVTTLLPARALANTARSLAGAGGEVDFALSGRQGGPLGLIGFSSAGRRTTSRVLDGQLPQVQPLLALGFAPRFRVATSELIQVVRRVALVAQRDTQLRLDLSADGLIVEAGGGQDARASEAVDCQVEGRPHRLALNPGYLLDGLNSVNAPVTVLSVDDSSQRVLLTGDRESEEDDADYSGFNYLLQPLRWNG